MELNKLYLLVIGFWVLFLSWYLQISKALAGADKKDLMRKLPKFIYDEEKALEVRTCFWCSDFAQWTVMYSTAISAAGFRYSFIFCDWVSDTTFALLGRLSFYSESVLSILFCFSWPGRKFSFWSSVQNEMTLRNFLFKISDYFGWNPSWISAEVVWNSNIHPKWGFYYKKG